MPRYHFNVHNGVGVVADEEGRELPDVDAARAEAVRGIRSLIAEEVMGGRVDLRGRLDLTDGDGKVLAAIGFADTVEIVR